MNSKRIIEEAKAAIKELDVNIAEAKEKVNKMMAERRALAAIVATTDKAVVNGLG